ncbi:MAG: Fis family transcriptional regulator, partial [Clostridia bacterium]|nr:Fis family transcriptional regulator [Clostridia bacterium]
EEGKFRTDLYYRLNTFPIHIPPLRNRPGDIPALAEIMLDELSRKLKKSLSITRDAVVLLQRHDWPGNVRELRNVLEFAAYLSPDGLIGPLSLPAGFSPQNAGGPPATLAKRTRAFERREILKLLAVNGADLNGKKKTAAQLGISLASLYNKLNAEVDESLF